jgi:hypothetical protein
MTGEMVKPPNAEKGESYWKGKSGVMGMGRAIGDDSLLIRPNYPEFFALADELERKGLWVSVEPFDVYQGPYLSTGEGRLFHGERGDQWILTDRRFLGDRENRTFRSRKTAVAFLVGRHRAFLRAGQRRVKRE